MTDTNRHYDEPPLEEAIFELFVVPSSDWQPAGTEEMARRLPAFAGKQEGFEDVSWALQLGPGRSVAQTFNPGARRTRLWNADQTRAVQFGADMCTFNVRRPYGHFADHRMVIRDVFAAHLAVASPKQVASVGQRYINFVRLPPESSPSDYFEIYPHLPAKLPPAHRPFAVQVETASFAQGTTVVNLALLELTADAALYNIDIYARSDSAVPLDADSLLAWQDRAHASIGSSFELTITDLARRLFKETS